MQTTSNLVQGASGPWEVVMGLEVHAQVLSKSKLFSYASTASGKEPNTNVSLFDASFPGMLPVLNECCVSQAVRTGIALNCAIKNVSVFDRKNYFYADLPSGYQITQFFHPITGPGFVEIDLENEESKKIRIHHIHLEQDAGKSMHDQHPTKSYIDLNRSGVALMEIVTEPDMRTKADVITFVKTLRNILRTIKTCDGNMESGNMRVDVNVSVRKPGSSILGTRTEIKNMNSTRYIQQAIDAEVARQINILEGGGEIIQQTLLFDVANGTTRALRDKESDHEYRYFPDPDLPPLRLADEYINTIRHSIPELPCAKRKRLVDTLALSSYDAHIITSDFEISQFYENALEYFPDDQNMHNNAKLLANWLISELFALLKKENITIINSPISSEHLASLVTLISDGVISGKIAKEVFALMWSDGKSPVQVVEEKGLKQIDDDSAILELIHQVLNKNSDKVQDYKNGSDKLFGFFVGQVMGISQGKANPTKVNVLLLKELTK